ncbi:MAG: GFA family protein [Pseudoxanthomonas sp.]
MNASELSCRCGEVGLRVSGDPLVQLYCHCNDCRAAHAAAYVAAAIHPAAAVEVVRGGPVPIVVKTTPRLRCAACGTHLFAELAGVGMRSVNAFLLPSGAFKPQFHVQCQHAVLPVVDELPHYRGFPAAFGGAEELVGW